MPEIRLEHVTKRFEKFVAVDDLNLHIDEHDFITLLGPSGCGKTTTLRMIAGLETPTEGKITIGDKVVFDAATGINVSPAKRDIGFLFQNYALWPHMTVYQNIAFGLENLKWKKEDIKVRVQEMLEMLRIEEFVGRYPAELSGGQQQRVAIARTLAPKPQVLFMDEPLSNLDAKLRSEMRTELKRLHSDSNSTFVYVTHDQLEAMTLATKICLMEKGVLQQYDPPLTVYSQPANRFVADFVGNPTMNFIDAAVKKEGGETIVEFLGVKAKFTPNDKKEAIDASEVVLGIRPEFFTITDNGKIHATAYSTLPSGMETTVKVKLADELVSSVVFGAIDYKVDQAIRCDIIGNQICVFDKTTTQRVSIGALEVL